MTMHQDFILSTTLQTSRFSFLDKQIDYSTAVQKKSTNMRFHFSNKI